jgi:protein phosphatase
VAEQHLSSAVKCSRCLQAFMVQVPAAQPATVGGDGDEDVVLDWDAPGAAARMDGSQSASHSQPVVSPGATRPTTMPRRLDIGSCTSVGKVRKHNEDSFLVQQFSWCNLDQRRELALVVVADGVGGYQAGDQASGLLIRLVGNLVTPLLVGSLTGQHRDVPPSQLTQTLDNALRTANATIFQRSQNNPACKGMASTAAAVLIWDGEVFIGHVGDCRVYHFRGGQLTQVTRDQTLLERMIQLGQLSEREAQNHPAKNEVLQAVGRHADVTPASYQTRLAVSDWMIVACDGLHAHVDARALENTLRSASTSAAAMANQLVNMANQGGGSDNCTVVAVRCY